MNDEIRAPFASAPITLASDTYGHIASDDGGKTWTRYFPAGMEPPFTSGRVYAQVIPTEYIRARIKALQRDLDMFEGRKPKLRLRKKIKAEMAADEPPCQKSTDQP